jgi:hypothetical protein
MSKYETLWNYLKDKKEESHILSFDQIKSILGFVLTIFLTYKKEALEHGYMVEKISIKQNQVFFKKIKEK